MILTFIRKFRRLICFAAILMVIMMIVTNYDDQVYIIEWKWSNDVTCHEQVEGDALSILGVDFNPPAKSIFVHETSCRGGLNSRQACSIESAARANTNWDVYVLFNGPISEYILRRSCLSILLRYRNVQLLRIHLQDYVKGTPVESIVGSKKHLKSKWRVSHTSDVLRYLTLYKYGGVYMDSDMIVTRSFDGLKENWAARESEEAVAAGILSFSRDALGRKVAEAAIQDVHQKFNPQLWGNNGPGVITRVMKAMCPENNMSKPEESLRGCKGFKVLPPVVFYPVNYRSNIEYFKANGNVTFSKDTYGHHLWNALSHKYNVSRDSPFAKLAEEYCPRVYTAYGVKFGV